MQTVKTYKRELAIILLIFWAFFVIVGFLGNPNGIETRDAIMWPIFGFLGGAFGMDAWAKQISMKKRGE